MMVSPGMKHCTSSTLTVEAWGSLTHVSLDAGVKYLEPIAWLSAAEALLPF